MTAAAGQVKTIFLQAVEIASGEERRAYLEVACGGDAGLRREVEELLEHHGGLGAFLQAPARDAATGGYMPVGVPEIVEGPGSAVGAYRLLEEIGEGGFGVVFLAEQHEPIRRRVALKVLKPGTDSKQVIARFEAERQALALMDHANIAKVLDAGQTDSGRPYFAMELVKGVPITEFCDQGQLTPRERLELFAHVCQAVQHAHQKGIIHRDIKPSNVLVTLQDGTPLVKVIDFGIAKALGQQLTDKTVCTGFAQMIGTPLYMSPEQAALSNVDVDTRSDVYSLGVLLYELLTGTTPFTRERLEQAGYDEMRRIIREEEPPRPSTRLSTLGQAATTISTQRRSDPKRLSQSFRGELDWIVMKALEKGRDRRYESASAFAADVQRYLHDEPVQACPPSAWYRFGKFARRNKRALAVAGMVLFVIVLLGAGVGWEAQRRAARQRETEWGVTAALARAETHLAEGDKQADQPERWQATARLALAVLEKAEELLATGVATEELTGRVRQLRALVEAVVADSRLLVELDRIRLEEAALKFFDAGRSASLYALYAKALANYGIDLAAPEAAAARVRGSRVRQALLAALAALEEWSFLKDKAERPRLQQVLRAAEPEPNAFRTRWRAAEMRRDTGALVRMANEQEAQALPAADLFRLANALARAKELAAAEQLLRAGLERKPGDFWLNFELGNLLLKPPRVEEAVRYLTAALALRSDNSVVHNNLGVALFKKGDLEGAIRRYRAALKIDPLGASLHSNLGAALAKQNKLDEAIDAHKEAIRLKPEFAGGHYGLGNALKAKGLLGAAIKAYKEAIRLEPKLAEAHGNLGRALRKQKRLDEAIKAFKKFIGLKPKDHTGYTNLGVALWEKGKKADAEGQYREAIRLEPKDHRALTNLGMILAERRQLAEAEDHFRKAIAVKPDFAQAHSELACALAEQNKLPEAVAECREAIRINPKDHGAYSNLGNYLRLLGEFVEAEEALRKAIKLKPDLPEAHYNLGLLFHQQRKFVVAEAEFRTMIKLNPTYAEAYCHLGLVLMKQGKFAAALPELRRGHELGSARPGWHHPSDEWVRECEARAAREKK
jgi:serine/threonine protein kinase/Flp pilus assembly protein TadD